MRPGVFDANASWRCWASVLIADDLPALVRPTNAISGMSPAGSCEILLAEVRNLAVCSQPRPSLASSETTTGFL